MIKNYVEAMDALDAIESFIDHLVNEDARLRGEISDLKTEVGRLEALLADKKSEGECECDYDCECCKHRDENEEESEPTLKDLYDLGRYLVDTVDEIESIHIRVVRNKNADTDDTNDAE